MDGIRLNKYIADSGYCSRRKADGWIAAGSVYINGEIVQNPGVRVMPGDEVVVNGEELTGSQRKVYLLLNKPKGYMSSLADPNYDRFVLDLIEDMTERIYPVGRLDVNSRGLLLLTNDGELSYQLTHPSGEIEKEYEVTLKRPLSKEDQRRLEMGVVLEGTMTLPAVLKALSRDQRKWKITIREGKKRQVRRMFEAVGNEVTDLLRVRIANLQLGDLAEGSYRELTQQEQKGLGIDVFNT